MQPGREEAKGKITRVPRGTVSQGFLSSCAGPHLPAMADLPLRGLQPQCIGVGCGLFQTFRVSLWVAPAHLIVTHLVVPCASLSLSPPGPKGV